MDEDVFNQQIRKFLKRVGITAQREIEKAVREGVEQGRIQGAGPVQARMTLELPELQVSLAIEDDLLLE
ncbi:MAG TPA: DUF6494 family protein [Gammaproteobacteria bacterium]|nr:DUF6494 family protein [Gammaproteobacteria bacterium]